MGLKGIYIIDATSRTGRITEVDAQYVTVTYKNKNTGRYPYPRCFTNKTLQPADTKARNAINSYLNQLQPGNAIPGSPSVGTSVHAFFNRYNTSISHEIEAIKSNEGKIRDLYDGKLVSQQGREYIYLFESDGELNYPPGTEIKILPLQQGQTGLDGTLLDCNDLYVLLCTEEYLKDPVSHLQFTEKSWMLLYFLQTRLQDKLKNSSALVSMLVNDGPKQIQYGRKIVTGQDNAVALSLNQPITFIWGPPGTGKTETLAKIVLEHLDQGRRILMVSHSNVAVDGAIMRVARRKPDFKPGELLRYGYPKDMELVNHPYLTASKLAMRTGSQYMTEFNALKKEQKTVARASRRYVQIRDRLNEISRELKRLETGHVKNARFVATTISMAVASKAIYEDMYDVVLFDEASMAYIPQVVYAASLAKTTFVCIGDYCQLPPIVQNNKDDSLKSDIFSYCGIVHAVENSYSHQWLCLLDTQYRMHSAIAGFISKGMYHSLLKTGPDVDRNRSDIVTASPSIRKAVSLADLSGMMSCALSTKNGSHFNILSALISFSLALQGAEKHEVGIISPYVAQSQLFRALARDSRKTNPTLKPITCATVHQFQGSEQDIIVYDAVDCYRLPYPGGLLTSMDHNTANRLFNVAMTRARGKFIGVGNFNYLIRNGLSNTLLFRKMINEYQGRALNGQELTSSDHDIAGAGLGIYDMSSANNTYLQDLRSAKKEIRIDIPRNPVNGAFLDDVIRALADAKKRNVEIHVRGENANSLPAAMQSYAITHARALNPVTLIDKETIWFGEPLSNAQFETQAGTIPTQHRPLIRFVGKRTAQCIFSHMDMDDIIDQPTGTDEKGKANTFAAYVAKNISCPTCGHPMRLKKGKDGSFFLSCNEYPQCKTTKKITKQLINDYFDTYGEYGKMCDKCRTSLLVKSGQYGIFIVCGSGLHKYKLDNI